MSIFKQNKDREQKEMQKLAEERGKVIDATVLQILDLMVEKDMSVNDFQVVCNQCLQAMDSVFKTNKVATFMEKK